MIHYIASEYRKPTPSTLGLWAQAMQPLMNMYVQHQLEESAWKERETAMQTAKEQELVAAGELIPYKEITSPAQEGRGLSPEPDYISPITGKRFDFPEPQIVPMDIKGMGMPEGARAYKVGYGRNWKVKFMEPEKANDLDKKLTEAKSLGASDEQLMKILGGYIAPESLTAKQKVDLIANGTYIPIDKTYRRGDPHFQYQGRAYGLNPKPLEQWETMAGPEGSVLQRSTTTGKLTTVLGRKAGAEKDVRESWQKRYDRFIENNPEYVDPKTGKSTINILDFKRLWDAKDPDTMALEIAYKNPVVWGGKRSLGEEALRVKEALSMLKEGRKAERKIVRGMLFEKQGDGTWKRVK